MARKCNFVTGNNCFYKTGSMCLSKVGCMYKSKVPELNSNIGIEVGRNGNTEGFIKTVQRYIERVVGKLFNR